jgi:hypothetical protein
MIAWKVLHPGLKSYAACGMAKLRYKIGVKTRAPQWLARRGYHPLVFRTPESALCFAASDYPIFKCKTGRVRKLMPIADLSFLDLGKIETVSAIWPEGTMMVEWVELLEEIKP